MILPKDYYGNFSGDPLNVGVSSENEYVPVYTIRSREETVPLYENIVSGIFSYEKPRTRMETKISNYADLIEHFRYYLYSGFFIFKCQEEEHIIYATRGCLLDEEGNILLILTANTTQIFEEKELKTSSLRLYVSTAFIKDEKYKNVYKNLYTNCILECIEKDVQVVFATPEEIEKRVFSNTFKVEYNNLTDLNDHLNNEIAELFNFEVPSLEEIVNAPFTLTTNGVYSMAIDSYITETVESNNPF
jgi:hypothetical protein